MSLYSRDYNVLTKDEEEQLQKAQEFYDKADKIFGELGGLSGADEMTFLQLKPEAAFHNESIFPNNLIYNNVEKHSALAKDILNEFETLIKSDSTSEREILNFIKNKQAYFILESILNNYSFGHHFNNTYLFREFPLSTSYKADFLLIGKNSGGYHLIFIEFEAPNGTITTQDGSLGTVFRKGISQVEEWRTWLDANYHSLRSEFEKHINPSVNLPKEFYVYDSSRCHYLVVAGTRKDFNEKTYQISRRSDKVDLLHYENLVDESKLLVRHKLSSS